MTSPLRLILIKDLGIYSINAPCRSADLSSVLAHAAMLGLSFDTANILAHDGISIALTGMTIVFIALSGISLFIACLPKLLAVVGRYFPEPDESPGLNSATPSSAAVDDAMIAAIALAMHRQRVGEQR